jgi:hypothetical protein
MKSKKQKQKGQIKRQKKDRNETEKGQIRFVDSKCFELQKDRNETETRQKKDRSKDTTIDPIINPNPKPEKNKNTYSNEFEECWKITPKRNGQRQGKFPASKLFEKLSLEDKRKLYNGLRNYEQYLKSANHGGMDLERFIRNRIFDDYQQKPEKDDGRAKAQRQYEETQRIINRV